MVSLFESREQTLITLCVGAILICAFYIYINITHVPLQVPNNAAFAGIFVGALAILFISKPEDTITDPLTIREEFINSPFGKHDQMKPLSEITEKYGFDTLYNPYTKENFYMWSFQSVLGWADIELYKGSVKNGDFPLLVYRPHAVEITRLDTFRSEMKKMFMSGQAKDAIDILKREGFLSKQKKRRGLFRSRKESEPANVGELRKMLSENNNSEQNGS
jgi:hypothetical protein